LRATSGRIFGGCNVENATYGLTVCAERVAIFKAISEGERGFDAIAVVTDTDSLTPPCGACRQLIWEFCGDVPVILSNLKGKTEVVCYESVVSEAVRRWKSLSKEGNESIPGQMKLLRGDSRRRNADLSQSIFRRSATTDSLVN